MMPGHFQRCHCTLPGNGFHIDITITAVNGIDADSESDIGTLAAAAVFFKLKENKQKTQTVEQRELNTLVAGKCHQGD